MFSAFEVWLMTFAASAPLPLVSFVVAIVEEIVPPIPASATIATIGSLAALQSYSIIGLLILTVAAALGKTIGSIGVYIVADKTEDMLTDKVGRYFGVTSADLEKFSQKLGKGARDYFVLTMLRSLPFIPSSLVSIGCGLLRISWPLYLTATFIGTVVRYGIFLYLGYIGAEILATFVMSNELFGKGIEVGVVVLVTGLLTYLYLKKRRRGDRLAK